jgi:hypothetical protein
MDTRVIAKLGSRATLASSPLQNAYPGHSPGSGRDGLFAHREMIHQQAIEEMNVVLSQRAQIQELIYVCRLESKLCQAYSLSIMQRLFSNMFLRLTSFLLFFI